MVDTWNTPCGCEQVKPSVPITAAPVYTIAYGVQEHGVTLGSRLVGR